MQQDLLLARGGSGRLYRCLLGAVCSGGRIVRTRRRKPHPVVRLCDCPVPRAFSMHRDVPHPWAHHPDLQVPPDGVTIYPSLSPPREPSLLKRFAPATVSAGTCTYMPSMSPPCEPSPLKHFAPATVSAGTRTYVPSMSPPCEPSPSKCFAPVTASAGLRRPRAPGLEDDVEEPTSTCPLSDAGQAMPGHPMPLLLSNLLRHHAHPVAFPTSAIERHALAPPRPPATYITVVPGHITCPHLWDMPSHPRGMTNMSNDVLVPLGTSLDMLDISPTMPKPPGHGPAAVSGHTTCSH